MAVQNPPRWSDSELEAQRANSEARFIAERTGEGAVGFYAAWDRVDLLVRAAMDITGNLRSIRGSDLVRHKDLWHVLRYFCAPPISEEDLWTLVGQKFANVRAGFADKTAAAFLSVVDGRRFPWVEDKRDPSPIELELAIRATTVLMAHESLKTSRRGSASKAQEDQVAAALEVAGLTLDPSRTAVFPGGLDEMARGTYARERKFAGAKCDIPVRLSDGRVLALECKVSNGPKNGWKRLQREVGGKAEIWTREFGKSVITGAVLAGSFDLSCLQKSQNVQGVFIFWQHDLNQLIEFVQG